jgi:cobalt/nickel transport system permease protein
MHIPDGYLSPSTCAGLCAGAAPFWYVALRRVRKQLHSRTIPLLGMFAAFSFVVMMFNLPLPGGTTGHAVGIGMATVVAGPWVSMLAVSIALLIQALFFGDGGISTYGANCFNMAIVGSLVTYGVYRALSSGADITSRRRVFAAGIAGYVAINIAALFAAIEFGIQPILFHDASGTPLYAPYPLSISIPAMMVGHLTFAGLAELVLSAGVVAYLQRADPELLRRKREKRPVGWVWIGLAVALVLTPLGILAVGGAWGEWRASSFSDVTGRAQIAAASSHIAPPAHAPSGLEKLSTLWKAPFADYAPRFIGNAYLAYFVAALIGVALIFVCVMLLRVLMPRRRRTTFLERTVRGLADALEEAMFAENFAEARARRPRFDPRVNLAGFAALLIVTISLHNLWVLLGLFALAAVAAVSVSVSLSARLWIAVLAFTGLIAIPALFLVPGKPLWSVFGFAVSQQGLRSAAYLIFRAETAATLSLLLIVCTPWNRLLRALRLFRVPMVAVMLLEAAYRFLFLLLDTAQNMFEARSTRLVGDLDAADQRRLAAASVGVLLDKTLLFSGEVHCAMQARGFRGEAMLVDDFELRKRDWLQLGACFALACAAIWFGR